MKKVLIFIGCIICFGLVSLSCLLFANYDHPHGWETLAVTTNAAGCHYFVRQQSYKGLCDVFFGYVDNSGEKYSYDLDHDSFAWKRIRLVEDKGQIYIFQNSSEKVASFDPDNCIFHNDIYSKTYDKQAGLEHGLPDSFFDLSITNEPQSDEH